MKEIKVNEITGFRIGHAQNIKAATGCTVVIAEKGATSGVDVRGGAPGTRETDLLDPVNLIEQVHAVFLAGGSAFGLDAASGIMKYLEEREIGFDVQLTRVPIVSGAVLFDLGIGDFKIRPDASMGYQACLNSEKKMTLSGNIGAGTGATVGKLSGMPRAMKGGLGSCGFLVGELQVAAIIAVNCFGDVINPQTGEILAGTLNQDLISLADTEKQMINYSVVQGIKKGNPFAGNTTLGIVLTNARLTKSQANKIASMAHNGYGRTIRPAHTMVDGDSIFTMASNQVQADINVVGLLAARAVERAVVNAITTCKSLLGFKSYSELSKKG